MTYQPPPKSESYQAFEAALHAAQQQHVQAMEAKRASRRPIGVVLLIFGLGLLGAALVMGLSALAGGGGWIMNAIFATVLLVSGIMTIAKGISMIAGRISS